jgi:hypothetical protein
MATTSERKWSWYGGIGYPIQIREDVVLALGADAILQKFEGNNVTYDGAGPVWGSSGPHPGELIDSKLEMNLYRVNGDVLWGSTLSGGSASLYMGPRFQYVRYADKFSITPTNSYASWSEDSRIRNYNMYGFGVAGQLPLGNLSGRSASGCDAGGSGLMSILPKLRGAYTLGWGNGMRYQAVEGFVEVKVGHDKLSFNLGGAAFNPGLLFQAGFIYMHVTETTENKVNAGLTGTSDAGYTDRADYWLKYPVLQATIAF